MALESGVDPGQISRFIRGERGVNLTSAGLLLDALGLDVRLVKRRTGKAR